VVEVVQPGATPADVCPVVDTFDARTLPPAVRRALHLDEATRVHRVRNPDIWDAMLMPIFQHRIGLTAAAHRYRAFCARYGTLVTTELGTTLLPPQPDTAATLDDDPEVAGRRMPAVRAAAREYLRLLPDRVQLPPAALYHAMRTIPGIGPWSAARVVADTTGDFSFHTQAGFGTRQYWQQHAAGPGAADQDPDLRTLWKSCTYREHSTAIALTTHQRFGAAEKAAEKAEAADTAPLHCVLRDAAARPTGSRP
jgi:hypothetical protein